MRRSGYFYVMRKQRIRKHVLFKMGFTLKSARMEIKESFHKGKRWGRLIFCDDVDLYKDALVAKFGHLHDQEWFPWETEYLIKIREFMNLPKRLGFVYLMSRDNGDFKIGLSNDPAKRLGEIRRQYSDVTLVHTIACDNPFQAERILHEKFQAFREDGEWFSLWSLDVLEIISYVYFGNGIFYTSEQ